MAAACREHFSDLTCVMSSCTSGRSCNESETAHSRAGRPEQHQPPPPPERGDATGLSRGFQTFEHFSY